MQNVAQIEGGTPTDSGIPVNQIAYGDVVGHATALPVFTVDDTLAPSAFFQDDSTGKCGVNKSEFIIAQNRTIEGADSDGIPGEVCFDGYFMYRCVAPNSWKRAPLQDW